MAGRSAIYAGAVMHRRLKPVHHHLHYDIAMCLFDLDELPALDRGLKLFAHNRFGLFSLRDRDYGDGSATPLKAQVARHLAAAGIDADGGRIELLTMPRLLGYAFNPLSVYFCHDRAGHLAAILYEVHNTFGERHSYLLPVAAGEVAPYRQQCAKDFHVSPFMDMALTYAFRVQPPAEKLMIGIRVADGDGALLTAAFTARRKALGDAALARLFVMRPFMTVKVMAGILWEALRLWLRRVPVHTHKPMTAGPVTVGGTTR